MQGDNLLPFIANYSEQDCIRIYKYDAHKAEVLHDSAYFYALGICYYPIFIWSCDSELVSLGGEYSMDKYGGIQIDDAYKDYDISQVHINIQHGNYYGYLENIR